MSNPIQFFGGAQGFFRDRGRGDLPRGFAWNVQDWIPNLGGPLRKRGGWAYATNDISAVSTSATYVAAVSFNKFTAATKICNVSDNGKLATSVPGSLAVTAVGTVVANIPPLQSPVQHRQLLIFPSGDGSTANSVRSYDGVSTLANVSAGHLGQFACVYRDRTVLANSDANPTRVMFSNAGDPTTWTSTSFFDTTYPVTAITPLRTAILVFSQGFCERLRGTTPPPGTDMSLEPVFEHGCLDARSVATYGDNVIFANAEGVFLTDGAAAVDLTAKGGIGTYWRNLTLSFTSSWTMAAGIFNGNYIISIMDGATFKDCLVCDLNTRTWTRHTNLKASCFAHAVSTNEELYWASRAAPRVNSVSSLWQPASAYKNDGDGTAVTPVLETAFVQGNVLSGRGSTRSSRISTFKSVFGEYELTDAATDNPTLALSYITSPTITSYTSLTDATSALIETTVKTKFRRFVGKKSDGLAWKVAQSNASADTILYALESEDMAREQSRLV